MQKLQKSHLAAKRNHYVKLKPLIFSVVQSNVFNELYPKKNFLPKKPNEVVRCNQIQKQLGLKRYEPVWVVVHKLRKAMGNRDKHYTLEDMIELDEGYFTVESSEIEKNSNKRGRGAVGQQNVAVMAESVPLYLDEFVYKLNRRYFGEHLFDRLF